MRIRKDESGKSGRKVSFTFDYQFHTILYACMSRKFCHEDSIL